MLAWQALASPDRRSPFRGWIADDGTRRREIPGVWLVYCHLVTFVYHAVPTAMVGEVIYSLNQLARVAPTAYQLQRGKYTGREAVLDADIGDGRLFNDTVHCSPLHPCRLFLVRRQLGLNPPPARANDDRGIGGLFFEIPVERIVTHPTFWYRWETPWINGYPGGDVAATPRLTSSSPSTSSATKSFVMSPTPTATTSAE